MGTAAALYRPRLYRPRHPERTGFYRIFEEHFERYVASYDERYEPKYGSLRPWIRPRVEEYLECGRLMGGFARIRCRRCRGEHLLAFSCQTRNFCPSCQAKRGALFAELLVTSILEEVPHRHVVFTIPKALRRLFQRERKLLGILSRCAFETMREATTTLLDCRDARPGFVASLQTFGSYGANFHPHVHAIVTDGAFTPQGEFLRMPSWNVAVLEESYRRRVLRALEKANRLSEHFHQVLLSWVHSGFSVHVGPPLLADDTDTVEKIGRYITRAPIKLDAVRQTAHDVLVRTPPDPRTGQEDLKLEPLDWIHNVCQQIPPPRMHMVRYLGWYSNRSRGARRARAEDGQPTVATPEVVELSPSQLQRRRSWARLMRRILEVDPLLCPKCQIPMRVVSVITDPDVVDRILRNGVKDPFEERGPPPG